MAITKINRRSYMRAHVLLNLLNEVIAIKCEACRVCYRCCFAFNDTRERVLDYIYHMTLTKL